MTQHETLNVMAEVTPDGKPRPAANSNQRRTTMDNLLEQITYDGKVPVMTTDALRNAVAQSWATYRRRTVVDAWKLGVALRRVRQAAFKGEWYPWLDSIEMNRDMARRFMELSKIDNAQIARYPTVDAALKALKEPPPKPPQPPIEGTATSTQDPSPPPSQGEGQAGAAAPTPGPREVPAPRTPQTDADTERRRQEQEDLEAEAEAMEAEEMERLREQEHREGREAIVKLQQLTGPNGQTGLAGAMETIVHKSKEIKALRGELKDVSDKLRKRESFINRIKENLLKDGNGDRVLREAWGLKRR